MRVGVYLGKLFAGKLFAGKLFAGGDVVTFDFDTVCPLAIPLYARTELAVPLFARTELAVPLIGCRNEV